MNESVKTQEDQTKGIVPMSEELNKELDRLYKRGFYGLSFQEFQEWKHVVPPLYVGVKRSFLKWTGSLS